MEIPSTAVHRAPLAGPGAWRRESFAGPEDWTYHLTPATIEELERVVRRAREQGRAIPSLGAEDFPVPSFERDAARLREEVRAGRGFVVIHGWDVQRHSEEENCLAYWGVSTFFGTPLAQNAKGDRLYSVRDEGHNLKKDYGTVGVRFSKSPVGLQFHTDSMPKFGGGTPDIVGLFALETAKSGGETAILSAQAVHNILLQERPDYLERLYAGYHIDRRAERKEGEPATLFAPILRFDGALQIRYFPFYIYRAQEVSGVSLTPADTAPLEFLDRVLEREELPVTFEMRRGDMQFVNNTFILHSRTAYEDHAEPERRRHYLRLWLGQRAS